jgi:two-component system response regulator YesN
MVTLMIADDEPLERQALQLIIQQQCPAIQVIGETGDGHSAAEIAAAQKPDIVVMDIRMPGMNGLEAAKIIRAGLPNTRIIMLTAFDEFTYAKQALTIGAVEYLLKPVRPRDIVSTLNSTLEKVSELRAKQAEEKKLRKNIESAIPFIQMSFVYDLISGAIRNRDNLRERCRFLGLEVEPRVALIVDIDHFKQLTFQATELEKQMIKQQVYQHICRTVGEAALVTPFESDNLIALLCFTDRVDKKFVENSARETAADIQECIHRELNIGVTIGIGNYYSDPREINKSYLEARDAERQRFYLGDKQIIHIKDVPYLSNSPFNYSFHYERTVLDKVRCGDRQQAKEKLHELLNGIFASKASIETVKACVLELLIVLSRSAVEGGANLEQLTLLNFSCIDQLTACSNKYQVEEWLLGALDEFMDNMLANRTSTNLRMINSACDYIIKNCKKNVSLEEVAKTVHLSPFYFSRLFKQEKGYNFVDFLTQVRIDKAKKLLQNPDYTAVRIAAEVGYQDASYFSRVFRQATGMTPNQYRHGIGGDKTI